jgi:hypothetical protein
MGDQLLPFPGSCLGGIAKPPHEGDRIRLIPTPADGEAAKAIRRSTRPPPQDDRVIRHDDIQPVARLDAERSASLAGHNDLVLGTDLDA